jgi:hypothetical protein
VTDIEMLGVYLVSQGVAGFRVWVDADADGVRDGGEEKGMAELSPALAALFAGATADMGSGTLSMGRDNNGDPEFALKVEVRSGGRDLGGVGESGLGPDQQRDER